MSKTAYSPIPSAASFVEEAIRLTDDFSRLSAEGQKAALKAGADLYSASLGAGLALFEQLTDVSYRAQHAMLEGLQGSLKTERRGAGASEAPKA